MDGHDDEEEGRPGVVEREVIRTLREGPGLYTEEQQQALQPELMEDDVYIALIGAQLLITRVRAIEDGIEVVEDEGYRTALLAGHLRALRDLLFNAIRENLVPEGMELGLLAHRPPLQLPEADAVEGADQEAAAAV